MKIIKGSNDLLTKNPTLVLEWNYDRNTISPDVVGHMSSKKVWWKCQKGHEWEAIVHNRARGNGCPVCANQKVLKGYNDLETINPILAKEWNYSKNGEQLPSHFLPHSNVKVWWKCSFCHYEWYASIHHRANGTGCPCCNNTHKVSESEHIIFYYLKKCFPDAIQTYRPSWMHKREIDIFIPSIGLAIEYDGEVWHKSIQNDLKKSDLIKNNGISLVRMREENCPELKDGSFQISVPSKDYRYGRLFNPINELINYINKTYNLTFTIDIDPENDVFDIVDFVNVNRREKSLLLTNPEVVVQWNYRKNKYITPESVLPQSNKVVWWQCDKGHEWKASIVSRAKGTGCPYCTNRRIITGFNDLATLRPDLATEWNYFKNRELSPALMSIGSHKKVWWKCNNNHEWEATVANRTNKDNLTGCPYCSNKKLLIGYNDLATVNPKLAQEWNYQKNDNLLPSMVLGGSGKSVWWKCHNNHEWKTTIDYRSHGWGCPYCRKESKKKKI